MAVEYQLITQLDTSANWYRSMCALHTTIFGDVADDLIAERLSSKQNFLIALALDGEQVIGCKIGYEESKQSFYSWLGGVLPAYRGQGIASHLMDMQHEWCALQGYTSVQTRTLNRWRNMLVLNLRHGFDIVGTYLDGVNELKIILVKKLLG